MCNISPLPHRLCAFWCCVLTLLPLTTADEAEKPVSDEDDDDYIFDRRTERTCLKKHYIICMLGFYREVVDGVAIQLLRCY